MPPKKATLTTRKMAKKGGQASFQSEVNSDEEWKFVLQKVGLVVIDVYSDWCGPCVGMMSNLKKVKLEVGNEYLHLAMANADKIRALERFRGKSEPTWVFIVTGQLLRVMYGSNAPLLMKTIEVELQNEMDCIEGKRTRITRRFSEPTPEEVEKMKEQEAKRLAEEEEIRLEKEEQLDKVKRRYYERVARMVTKQSVVLYFPHTFEETDDKTKKKICPAAYKLMTMYDQVDMSIKDQLEVQLTEETIPKVFYNSGVVLPKTLLNVVIEQPCIASLIHEYLLADETEETPSLTRLKALEHIDVVEKKLATLIYGPQMDPFNPDPGTVGAEFMFVTPKGIKVPPLWTPKEHISKAAALEVLFPYVIEELGIEMEPLPPPSYIMIFEANRAREVLDAAEPFAEDVLHIAYFDSIEPDKATKMCQTIYDLEKFGEPLISELKMVIALQKKRSDPMLVLAQMGPVYISGDVRQGVKEVEMFFPPTIEEELEPDPWAPPPMKYSEDGDFLVDEDGHRYREEYIEDEKGETKLMKHYIRLADGTRVSLILEFGESLVIKEKKKSSLRMSRSPSSVRESRAPSTVEEVRETMDEGERPSMAGEGEAQGEPAETEGEAPPPPPEEEPPAEE